jgi:methylated-DNA-[protein]-cysteine S-methyltransferase
MASPVGPLLMTSDGAALNGLYMNEHRHGPDGVGEGWVNDEDAAPLPEAKRQLAAYFAGERADFDLPLAAEGTAFQKKVWAELCRIPCGETISYGELARRIGAPNASRAVGLANGRNPISIVVPCHRVIGAGGRLIGYGGGLERKGKLLAHERDVLARRGEGGQSALGGLFG